jgi:hypothetical protein
MMSKAAQFFFAFAVTGFAGLSACMTPADPRVSESTADLTSQNSDESLGGGGICCITYTCPTNPEIERIGCKNGPSGPGGAFRACQTACGTICDAGEWVCE